MRAHPDHLDQVIRQTSGLASVAAFANVRSELTKLQGEVLERLQMWSSEARKDAEKSEVLKFKPLQCEHVCVRYRGC